MEPTTVIWIVAALLAALLLAFALTRRPRAPGPPPRRSRNAFQRFWDTPEHSDAWRDEERPAERR